MVSSLILDLILILFFLFYVFRGYKKGLISSLFGLFGTIITLILSNILSTSIAAYLYDNFIRESIINSVVKELETGSNGFISSLQDTLNNLPVFLQNSLFNSGVKVNDLNQALRMDIYVAAKSVSDLLRPVVVGILQLVVFVALFFIFKILFSFLSRTFDKLNRLPIMGNVNKMLGAGFAFLQAIVLIYILCTVIKLVSSFNSDIDMYIFNQANINSSLLFKCIYNFNPLNLFIK